MNEWYVISVRSAAEEAASNWITTIMRGLTYYPSSKRSAVAVAKKAKVAVQNERAAFYGYVFASFNYIPDWEVLRQCASINGLLKIFSHEEIHDGIPYPVYIPLQLQPDDIVSLRTREVAGEFDAQGVNPLVKKLVGQVVRIPYGLFMGQQGKVKKVIDGNVKVTLPVIAGARPTELSFSIGELFTSSQW